MKPDSHPLVLVAADDDAVRQTLIDILEINGFATVSACDGAEALAFAHRDRPAAIITDIQMPVMTGFDLLERIRSDEVLRTTPVIVVSAKADRAATRRGMELGADDYITKPFSEDEVLRSLHTRLEKLELLNELDSFAHTVAHDLKNPLTTLIGRLELLEMLLGSADEAKLRKNLGEAVKSAERLSGIINEILMLASVRRQSPHCEPLDTQATVTEAIDRLEELVKRTGATIDRPDTWPAAFGYQPWVVHVWTNYIGNAAKYAGPNARITLGADENADGEKVRFWVRDAGPGLTAAAQEALFVPFARLPSLRVGGHGLGLSIVRRIVEKLGGQVGVESQPGRGALFWFELPGARTPGAFAPFPS